MQKKCQAYSTSVAFSNYLKINARNEIKAFYTQKTSTTEALFIEILMKEIGLVVTEGRRFLSRDESELIA